VGVGYELLLPAGTFLAQGAVSGQAAVLAQVGPFDAIDEQLRTQLVASVILLVVLIALWVAVVHGIARRIDDSAIWYQARKAASYTAAVITVVGLLWIWVGALRQLGTFFGLLSAGVAIALSDLLKNVAGWLYILVRRPYRVDDRIEIDGVRGDVIDIRMFRTTLLEIGNWVDADQSTGRIVHIPNGKVLSTDVFNATEGFGYLWHELPVKITFESDWRLAEQLFLDILNNIGGHTTEEAAIRIRRTARSYKIRYTHLTPTVYLSVRDSGVLLTGRVLVDTRRRRSMEQQIWRALLEAFEDEAGIELAYPTTRFVTGDPHARPESRQGLPAELDAGTRSSPAGRGRTVGGPDVRGRDVAGRDESGPRDERQDDELDGGDRRAATHDARDVPRG
jgi:small-conductance mechanosensitive channel